MPEIKASPRNRALGLLADAMSGAKSAADNVQIPVLGGLGSLLFGDAPELVNDVAYYGPQALVRGGNAATGGLGTFAPDRRILDAAGVVPMAPGSARMAKTAVDPRMYRDAAVAAYGPGVMSKIFIGEKAKTWNKAKADAFKRLEAEGVSNKDAYFRTMTYRGPDGKLRQEIDDSAAFIKTDPLPMESIDGENVASFTVKDALSHNPLFAAYPDIANIRQSFDSSRGSLGSYKPGLDWISLSDTYRIAQTKPKDAEKLNLLRQEFDAINNSTRGKRYDALLNGIIDKDPMIDPFTDPRIDRVIKRFGGEIEAKRNVLSEAERIARGNAEILPIGFTLKPATTKTTQLHELQHAIQEREGFEGGGNLSSAAGLIRNRDLLGEKQNNNVKMLTRAIENNGIDPNTGLSVETINQNLLGLGKKLEQLRSLPSDPYAIYKNLAGEAEARAVQSRMNMTPEQRRMSFPLDSYDVPLNELIVRGLLD